MHIILANNIFPPHVAGGAELIVKYLGGELARRGHQVTVVATCDPSMEPYPAEDVEGVRVLRFFPSNMYWSFDRTPKPSWKKSLWHIRDAWNLSASERLDEILRESPPDILHTHVINGFSASIWRAAKRRGVAVLHTAHDYHLICPRAFMMSKDWKLCTKPSATCRAYGSWHTFTTRYVDLFTSPSRFLIEQHQQRGLRPTALAVVPNGIPLPEPKSKESGDDGRRPLRLLLIARLTFEKGVRVVLEAMKHLNTDDNITLDIAGKGPLEDEVASAAASDARIRYHGFVTGETKDALFRASDCVLLPSLWYENAPVVVIEAGAYGLGVVGSRIGAIPEFVKDGQNGVLFEPGDPKSLAQAMRQIANNRSSLGSFRVHGAEFASRSTVEAMTDKYVGHYEDLVRSRRRKRTTMDHSSHA